MPPTRRLSLHSLISFVGNLLLLVVYGFILKFSCDFLPSLSLLSAVTILFRKSKWERTKVTFCCSHDEAAARPQRRRCSSRLLSASFVASPFHPLFVLRTGFFVIIIYASIPFCGCRSSFPSFLLGVAKLLLESALWWFSFAISSKRAKSGFWFIGVFTARKILPAV